VGSLLACALAIAGCGSGADERAAAPPPRLPSALAGRLAHASDSIAAALDAGDGCSALTLARALQQQTIAAINAHQVAAPLQEPLQASVNDLVGRIQCVPPVEEGDQQGNGNGQGKGRHEGQKKHGQGEGD
jgi:hypothetical protein